MTDKARELLEWVVDVWGDDEEVIYANQDREALMNEIRVYLDTPEPTQNEKPVAFWDTQNGTLTPAVPLSSERTCFKVPPVPLYLHPRSDIVDELVEALKGLVVHDFGANGWNHSAERHAIKARAALAKLEEE